MDILMYDNEYIQTHVMDISFDMYMYIFMDTSNISMHISMHTSMLASMHKSGDIIMNMPKDIASSIDIHIWGCTQSATTYSPL